jgi:tRNA (cytidine/uridine-2'-O-)-methyltransferase
MSDKAIESEPAQLCAILYHPEIPQNTGNIARTCAALKIVLHLVKPYGFSLADRYLKRAGLDYWPLVDLKEHASLQECKDSLQGFSFYYFSASGANELQNVNFAPKSALVFGPESTGLPEALRQEEISVRIRHKTSVRSLNLATAAGIALYQAAQSNGFLYLP